MNKPEQNSDLIEDMPSSWAKLVTQRIIFRAQIQAKITERAKPIMRIICKIPPGMAVPKDYL